MQDKNKTETLPRSLQLSLICSRATWATWPSACSAITRHTTPKPSLYFHFQFQKTSQSAPFRYLLTAAGTPFQSNSHAAHVLDLGLTLIFCAPSFSLCPRVCAGLLVAVLRADCPDRRRSDAVFRVRAEERNYSPDLFRKTSWDPHIAPETVGNVIC